MLDTPEPNAFALPGGRVFVTRGMLALIGDEAELAAVLGHEIGHALAGHGLAARGGASERERRSAEFAADRLGMRLSRGGRLRSRRAGRLPGDARREPGARRPARGRGRSAARPATIRRSPTARSWRAREAARLPARGVRNRDAYLDAIDGLTWGDGRAQGYARGRTFLHPELGFAFDAPPDYLLANQPDAVVASGPRGAVFLLDSRPDPGGSPEAYLTRGWVPEIAREVRTGPVEDLRRTVQHGLAAAEGRIDLSGRNSRRVAELTVVRLDGRFYRLTGLHAPGDRAAAAALDAAAASFRPLPASEARRLPPAAPAHPPRLGRRRPPRPRRRDAGRGRAGPLRHAERPQPRQAAPRRRPCQADRVRLGVGGGLWHSCNSPAVFLPLHRGLSPMRRGSRAGVRR